MQGYASTPVTGLIADDSAMESWLDEHATRGGHESAASFFADLDAARTPQARLLVDAGWPDVDAECVAESLTHAPLDAHDRWLYVCRAVLAHSHVAGLDLPVNTASLIDALAVSLDELARSAS